jgi:hypothetical protein
MSSSSEDPIGVLVGLVLCACIGSCGYGAYVLWEKNVSPDRLTEKVIVECKQGAETVFSGIAMGEPVREKGSVRITLDDGNVTVIDDSARCVTSTLRNPKVH